MIDVARDRVAAEGVRTALHLRTRYLIAERDMPSVQAAIAGELDAEYQRGYKAGYDRASLEMQAIVAGYEAMERAMKAYVVDQPCECFDEYGQHRPQWFRDMTWMCDRCRLMYAKAGGE